MHCYYSIAPFCYPLLMFPNTSLLFTIESCYWTTMQCKMWPSSNTFLTCCFPSPCCCLLLLFTFGFALLQFGTSPSYLCRCEKRSLKFQIFQVFSRLVFFFFFFTFVPLYLCFVLVCIHVKYVLYVHHLFVVFCVQSLLFVHYAIYFIHYIFLYDEKRRKK
jgi:hypothetical protein